MNKAVVLFSGGLKSTIALLIARRYNPTVIALRVDCPTTSVRKKNQASLLASRLEGVVYEVVSCGLAIAREEDPHNYEPENAKRMEPLWERALPGSMDTYLAVARTLAVNEGCREIYTGILRPMASDLQSQAAVPRFDPFAGMSMGEVVRTAHELDRGDEADMWAILRETYSCDVGLEKPCLDCRACYLRAEGFREAGLADPYIKRCVDDKLLPSDQLLSGVNTNLSALHAPIC